MLGYLYFGQSARFHLSTFSLREYFTGVIIDHGCAAAYLVLAPSLYALEFDQNINIAARKKDKNTTQASPKEPKDTWVRRI
jgi:hypothetical protein